MTQSIEYEIAEKLALKIQRVEGVAQKFEEIADANLSEWRKFGSPERHSRHFAFSQAARHLREVLESEG